MTRRRDPRRVGRGPYLQGLRRVQERWGSGFPFDVPAVAQIEQLDLDAPIALLAGDNGTGKSTLIEAIAEAMGYGAEGGELDRSGELPAVPRAVMGGALALLAIVVRAAGAERSLSSRRTRRSCWPAPAR